MKTNTSQPKEKSLVETLAMTPVTWLVQLVVVLILAALNIGGTFEAAIGVAIVMPFVYTGYEPSLNYYRRLGIFYRSFTVFLAILWISGITRLSIEVQLLTLLMVVTAGAAGNLLKKGEEIEEEKWKQILNTLGQHSGWRVV